MNRSLGALLLAGLVFAAAPPAPASSPCSVDLAGLDILGRVRRLEETIAKGCLEESTRLDLCEVLIRAGELEKANAQLVSLSNLDATLQRRRQDLLERATGLEGLKQANPVLRLVLVEAYDPDFPAPESTDVDQILEEFKRVVGTKLGDAVSLEIERRGRENLESFFAASRHGEDPGFQQNILHQYDLVAGAASTAFSDPGSRSLRLNFLRQWPLPSLVEMIGEPGLKTYEEFHDRLMTVWHGKVAWLKERRRKDGQPMMRQPLAPIQSDIHWRAMTRCQDRFDILVTNGFVMLDDTRFPHPHAVLKHGKIGGSATASPLRPAMEGQSIIVNVFEHLGDVEGIRPTGPPPDRELRNRMVGSDLLAHELGHAYFRIPDVYDHGDECLMNSNSHTLDSAIAYEALHRTKQPCPRCMPYIQARVALSQARLMKQAGSPGLAAMMYRYFVSTFPPTAIGAPELYHPVVAEARPVWIELGDRQDREWLAAYDAKYASQIDVTSGKPKP